MGRPAKFTDQQGDTVTHVFDLAGRLVRRDYRLHGQTQLADRDTLSYDDAGRLLAAKSGRYSNTVSMVYDDAGRLTRESLAVNFGTVRTYSVNSVYDTANRRTKITYPDASVVTRSYTGRDQLAQIGYNAGMVASFAYDDGGRRTTRTLGDTPGTVTTWSYGRSDNLPTGISTPNVTSFAYTYDANKNKLTETIGGSMQPYGFTVPTGGYDAENRLVGWNRDDSNLNQSWGLSLAGDWNSFTQNGTQQTRTHNRVHELTAVGSTSLSYDAKGNTTGLVGLPFQAVWDFDNRMSAATVSSNTHNYTYDALGRRVSKTVRDGENAVTTVYVSSIRALQYSPHAGQEVAEYAANALPTAPSRKFVYGDYIDEPVMQINVSGGTETKYYYHANSLFNVAALTDQSGTVQERYAYTAYGKPLVLDPNTLAPRSTSMTPYLFTGRRLDAETEMQYSRARYYEFDLGRFLGRDPIGYRGGIDLYEYVGDSPLGRTDSTGLSFGYDDNCSCKIKMGDVADKANKALQSQKCQDWFKAHGFNGAPGDTPGGYVKCKSKWNPVCLAGFPSWTAPGADIGLCNNALESGDPTYLASLLIHELAHHYCPWGSGREDCAISAQNACQIP